MFHWFVESGIIVSVILTLILVASFVVMIKAPKRLREVGIFAVLVAVISVLCNAKQLFDALAQVDGNISPNVLFTGMKIYAIRLIYGFSICAVTVVERFFTKPKNY